MNEPAVVSVEVVITNPTGLHARPAVKLTKLAKSFAASVRLRVGPEGKWTDAKSVARVLALKAPMGQRLFFEAEGRDAREALLSITGLVVRNFDEGSHREHQFEGQVACAGLSEGVIFVHSQHKTASTGRNGARSVHPATERTALESALQRAASELERLMSAGGAVASEIIEFQIELLRDGALLEPAFRAIDEGKPAGQAFGAAVDAQIADYRSSSDKYFAARASDLDDLRERVLAALAPGVVEPTPLVPDEGGIYVSDDLTPSRFLELDWTRWRGVALLGGSTTSHVAILARSRGVPLLVGVRASLDELASGEPALLDAENGRLIVSPSDLTTSLFKKRTRDRAAQSEVEERYRSAPAISGSGTRITVRINVESEQSLVGLSPDACDGIGLVRTEFLFDGEDGRGLPDEEQQLRFYRRLIDWAGGKPVTVRTLDAGGDKPIAGLTPAGELNPFLGVRGIRLSFAHPEVFRVQLRALARAAAAGPLKVMLPMITVPDELEQARRMLDEEVAALGARGVAAAPPPLGIMVEVPAVAIAIARFDAAFYSIGTNDLVQYVTASSRGAAELAALHDPLNPAVLELIARVALHGRATGREVSVCGEMASTPRLVPYLLEAGITSLSVAAATLGVVKHAVASHAR